jgi:hypothetical protein
MLASASLPKPCCNHSHDDTCSHVADTGHGYEPCDDVQYAKLQAARAQRANEYWCLRWFFARQGDVFLTFTDTMTDEEVIGVLDATKTPASCAVHSLVTGELARYDIPAAAAASSREEHEQRPSCYDAADTCAEDSDSDTTTASMSSDDDGGEDAQPMHCDNIKTRSAPIGVGNITYRDATMTAGDGHHVATARQARESLLTMVHATAGMESWQACLGIRDIHAVLRQAAIARGVCAASMSAGQAYLIKLLRDASSTAPAPFWVFAHAVLPDDFVPPLASGSCDGTMTLQRPLILALVDCLVRCQQDRLVLVAGCTLCVWLLRRVANAGVAVAELRLLANLLSPLVPVMVNVLVSQDHGRQNLWLPVAYPVNGCTCAYHTSSVRGITCPSACDCAESPALSGDAQTRKCAAQRCDHISIDVCGTACVRLVCAFYHLLLLTGGPLHAQSRQDGATDVSHATSTQLHVTMASLVLPRLLCVLVMNGINAWAGSTLMVVATALMRKLLTKASLALFCQRAELAAVVSVPRLTALLYAQLVMAPYMVRMSQPSELARQCIVHVTTALTWMVAAEHGIRWESAETLFARDVEASRSTTQRENGASTGDAADGVPGKTTLPTPSTTDHGSQDSLRSNDKDRLSADQGGSDPDLNSVVIGPSRAEDGSVSSTHNGGDGTPLVCDLVMSDAERRCWIRAAIGTSMGGFHAIIGSHSCLSSISIVHVASGGLLQHMTTHKCLADAALHSCKSRIPRDTLLCLWRELCTVTAALPDHMWTRNPKLSRWAFITLGALTPLIVSATEILGREGTSTPTLQRGLCVSTSSVYFGTEQQQHAPATYLSPILRHCVLNDRGELEMVSRAVRTQAGRMLTREDSVAAVWPGQLNSYVRPNMTMICALFAAHGSGVKLACTGLLTLGSMPFRCCNNDAAALTRTLPPIIAAAVSTCRTHCSNVQSASQKLRRQTCARLGTQQALADLARLRMQAGECMFAYTRAFTCLYDRLRGFSTCKVTSITALLAEVLLELDLLADLCV